MPLDIVDLRDFYARPLGGIARRIVRAKLRARWPNLRGERLLGVGYATPFLGVFREDAERILAFCPGQQGVSGWPAEGRNAAALVEDGMWPLADGSVDRIIAAHALETSESAVEFLREAGRCLAPGGRLIAIVPNRRGPWARMDSTPFGHGRPFSRSQLTDLLRQAQFGPEGWDEALFMPPVESYLVLRTAMAVERFGAWAWAPFAGVHIVEATKQATRPTLAKKVRKLKPSLAPSPLRAPQPAARDGSVP